MNLIDTATQALRQDVGPDVPVITKTRSVFLRLLGQESTVEVPFGPALATDFQEKYRQLYGHFPGQQAGQQRPIEVESIRVIVSTAGVDQPVSSPPVIHRHAVPTFQTDTYPAFDWTQLQEGDTFRGPALLLNTTSSAFIEPGWRIVIQADKNALVDYIRDTEEVAVQASDEVIQLELFTQRFRAIAEEMGTQLQRTAFSVNVKERLDFSCALLDANAELVANAPHIPVHLGSLGICARLILAKIPIGPGDVVITNHPKYGGSHLPDVTLLSGVFTDDTDGNPQLLGYVINRAHHAEIGGKVPGSMPPDATSLVEEGVVLEPIYIAKAGKFLWDSDDDSPEQRRCPSFYRLPLPHPVPGREPRRHRSRPGVLTVGRESPATPGASVRTGHGADVHEAAATVGNRRHPRRAETTGGAAVYRRRIAGRWAPDKPTY